ATSLLDYGPGQSTATFTDTNFPNVVVSLSSLPTSVVAKAAQVVSAAGITDPVAAAAAEYDYIVSGGDLAVVADDANQFQGVSGKAAQIVPSTSAGALLGVIPDAPSIAESQSGATAVTFDVYLTAAQNSDTEVDYTVIAPNAIDLGASAFGGTFPSGKVTIS